MALSAGSDLTDHNAQITYVGVWSITMQNVSYTPLAERLASDSAAVVEMSFAEVEGVLGRPLPASARGKVMRQWWANTPSHSHARAWLNAGRKARLDVNGQRVAFTRSEPREVPAAANVGQGNLIDISGLSPRAFRLIDDVSEEKGVNRADAITDLLEGLAAQRIRETLNWFKGRSRYDGVSSAELIREDRDSR